MLSQWPAVGAETDTLRRARQLQRTWERLLADGALGPELPPGATAGLRPTIVESWQRSLATGLDPTDLLAPIEADESEVLDRWFEHPLGSLTHVLTEQLRKVAEESRSMVVVTDALGLVLHRVGDEWLKERALADMNLVEGARYSEAADGTNGIGTALAADHPLQVFAFEHFNERHHEWACSAAPVHDPVSGQTIGLIDLSSLWKIAHPRSLELVTTAARTIEQRLLDARRDRDARLLRRYSDLASRSTDLLVTGDGYVLAGDESTHPTPLDIPEGGGEIVLDAASVAVAEPLGQGEAYLVRRLSPRGARAAPIQALDRAEERGREVASEQAALRQVATLVARESSPGRLFAVVAEQVAQVFDVPLVRLVRYEPDGLAVVGAFSEGDDEPFPIGSRWPLDTPGVAAIVRETGRPARVEDYAQMPGQIAVVVRGAGMRSAVGSPIVVEGRLWGAMLVLSPRREPLPEDTETRLTDFTELVATAIANAESRVAIGRLVDEQAALRRVATLVAQDAVPAEIFAAVSAEVDRVFGLDPATFDVAVVGRFEPGPELVIVGISKSVDVGPLGSRWPLDDLFAPTHVLRTGRSARIRADDVVSAGGEVAEFLRHSGYLSQVASPIVVDGRLWGAMLVTTRSDLPPDTEDRLEQFTELVATAIANAESRDALALLADEQAALRRVATLVAEDVPASELFDAVTREVGALLGGDFAGLARFEDDTVVTVGVWAAEGEHPAVPPRWQMQPGDPATTVSETRGAARWNEWTGVPGPIAEFIRELGIRSTVGTPIIVGGRLWGALALHSKQSAPLAPDTEARMEQFTELVGTAIANREARAEVERLADEQAALRRVATLVAHDAPREEVFTAIASEIGHLFGLAEIRMVRYDDDRTGIVVAGSGPGDDFFPVGSRVSVDAESAASHVAQTGEPVRMDYGTASGAIAEAVRSMGIRSVVAAPIAVEGRVWGAIAAGTTQDEPLPPETESRLGQFTELMATAVANTESRAEVERLADEQAALRRVATLVAEGSSPRAVLDAVAAETERVLGAHAVMLSRYEPDEEVTVVARRVPDPRGLPVGTRVSHQGENVTSMVRRTGRPARIEDYERARGPIADLARAVERNVRSAVGAPIVVDGRLWGVIVASWGEGSPPRDTEERMAKFAQLLDTAIANADSRDQLVASRARLVAASDAARRRFERDLHDGVQQRLVSLSLELSTAQAMAPPENEELAGQLAQVGDGLRGVLDDLRELSRGIHPAILSEGGLVPALRALARRSAVPVELELAVEERLAERVEVGAYYVVSEALANAAKHAQASKVEVRARANNGKLELRIDDDGVGGADPAQGSGLTGLADRVEALGGSIAIVSPRGEGTSLCVELSLDSR